MPESKITRWGRPEDEIVGEGQFHMERMSASHIWFSAGGESFDLTVTKGGMIRWTRQAGPWPEAPR